MLRVQLGGKYGGIISQEFTEVSIPPNLMVGTSDVSFFFFFLSVGIEEVYNFYTLLFN